MGGTQSTRRITVINDESAGVIKISDSLVQRIRGKLDEKRSGESESKEEGRRESAVPTAFPLTPNSIPSSVTAPATTETLSEELASPKPLTSPTTPRSLLPITDVSPKLKPPAALGITSLLEEGALNLANLSSLRVKQEKEEELKKIEAYWINRLKDLDEKHTQLNNLSKEEFNSALQSVEKLFLKATCASVCQDSQDMVMKCYQKNPKHVLNCSKEVQAFAACVDLTRMNAVINKG